MSDVAECEAAHPDTKARTWWLAVVRESLLRDTGDGTQDHGHFDVKNSKPLGTALTECLRTLMFTGFFVMIAWIVVDALATGIAKIPVRFSDDGVTWSENPGWFAAITLVWLAGAALLGYAVVVCFRRWREASRKR